MPCWCRGPDAPEGAEAILSGDVDPIGADLPPLMYLTVDSMSEGVGRSQVLPYVVGLAARGVAVTLHSFEKLSPDPAVGERLAASGVRWYPHRFRGDGAPGGMLRVAQGAVLAVRAPLVHARSDLAAASCLLGRKRRWIWDMRALWREERMAAGILAAGSPQERVMRRVEDAAARSSAGVITLSDAAVKVLGQRYGDAVVAKSRVITTCVDLERFAPASFPPLDRVRFLLAGSLSPVYDVVAMTKVVERMARRRPAELVVLTPDPGQWADVFTQAGASVSSADAASMPGHVRAVHVGLSMRHPDISNAAAMPTKLGEFLAAGRPVVVSPGLGDMDELLARYDCGVIVRDTTDEALDEAAADLERLVEDPDTPTRCRALAQEHFDLNRAVDALVEVYRAALS